MLSNIVPGESVAVTCTADVAWTTFAGIDARLIETIVVEMVALQTGCERGTRNAILENTGFAIATRIVEKEKRTLIALSAHRQIHTRETVGDRAILTLQSCFI